MAELDNTKTRNRYAYAVVSVGFIVVLSIWVLNTTLIEEKRKLQQREEWAYQVKGMIERLEDLERRGNRTMSAAINVQFLENEPVPIDPVVHREQENLANEIAVESAAVRARTGTLGKSYIEKILNGERAQRLMDQSTADRIKQILIWLSSKSVWPHRLSVQWVVKQSFWQGRSSGGGDSGRASISPYVGRLESLHTEVPRSEILSHQLLLTQRFSDAKEVLLREWRSAWERVESRPDNPTTTTIMPYGMRLGLNELPVIGAQALVFLQAIFFVLWNKEKTGFANGKNAASVFDFPAFGSPTDPLEGPPVKSLAGVLERSIWALYLLLPICVLAVGILVRYDFTASSGETFWSSLLFAPRNCDVSLAIDYVHLGALALSLGLTWSLTTPVRDLNKISQKRNLKRIFALVTIALALVAAIGYRWLSVSGFFRQPSFPGASSSWYYGECIWSPGGSFVFATIWAITLIVSIYYRRRFMAAISLIALTLFFVA
jgi:hypothetical protein